ncbi:MAG: 2,3,4,5-tetrahydropyridine-2,6-dicarboxylate N-succinyltransferase [Pseudomonadota bacterium]
MTTPKLTHLTWQMALDLLEKGELRSAEKINGKWQANREVKEKILEAFRAGELTLCEDIYTDKHTLMPQQFDVKRGIRIVPRGSAVRRGSFLANGVIMMPPSYVNVGAYIDEGTLIDSHVLVGSCAQIGKHVHLSAGVQIGGVLEPIGAAPVVIEDNCFIGADAIIVEGIQVLSEAIIAPGVILSKSVQVFDVVNNRQLDPYEPIPSRAVVVPGSRPIKSNHAWAKEMGLHLNCAIIIKYRDSKTDAAVVLEESLR